METNDEATTPNPYFMHPIHPEGEFRATVVSAETLLARRTGTAYINIKLNTGGNRPPIFLQLLGPTRHLWELKVREWLARNSIDPWDLIENDARVICDHINRATRKTTSMTVIVEHRLGEMITLAHVKLGERL